MYASSQYINIIGISQKHAYVRELDRPAQPSTRKVWGVDVSVRAAGNMNVFLSVLQGIHWTDCELLDDNMQDDQEVIMAWFEVWCGVFREVRKST